MKTAERGRARRLRQTEGLPIKEIARRVGVASSTVSLWVRDIELTPDQHRALQLGNPAYNRQLNGWKANIERGRARRRNYQGHGRRLARQADPLFIAGCMLYWAEGSKDRHQLRFSNSDPAMIRFFLEFLRRFFAIPDEKVRITCNLFADHEEHQHETESFWLDLLELPRACLCTSTVNHYSRYSKKKRLNKLPFGTCRVAVGDTRVVQTIYGSIQEYAGFDRPEWLG